MIAEAPFLFSVAGLSASLAGLAGLVAALRRGTEMRPIDLFRLRQIVEFAFANILLALATIPLGTQLGLADGIRIVALAAVVYAVASSTVLMRRIRLAALHWSGAWRAGVTVLSLSLLLASLWAIAVPTVVALETLLILLLARPMLAFLFVLASFER